MDHKIFGFFFLLALVLQAVALDDQQIEVKEEDESVRDKKAFFLFNVVTFKNTGCTSSSSLTSGARNGTCYTSSECSSKGGNAYGSCAAGFGVCCVFIVSTTGNINQNCTYLRNPSYPSVYTSTSAVTYTVHKCTCDVCFLRLDFDTFTTQGPSVTTETNGGVCVDSFKVTTTSGSSTPNICGLNTGHHIYVDIGEACSNTATISFTFGAATSTSRIWEIKATQIECWNSGRPPNGCLQYLTDLTGRITTFNFASTSNSHLASQDYSICIRQHSGYCCVQYTVCNEPMAFTLDTKIAAKAEVDSACIDDYIGIPGSSEQCSGSITSTRLQSKYCGGKFGTDAINAAAVDIPICDCTKPFEVLVHTDAFTDEPNIAIVAAANTIQSRGVCLEYKMLAC